MSKDIYYFATDRTSFPFEPGDVALVHEERENGMIYRKTVCIKVGKRYTADEFANLTQYYSAFTDRDRALRVEDQVEQPELDL